MRAVLAKEFGKAADVLSLSSSHPRPVLAPGSGKLLVRVHASSLSPGDWRTLSGSADLVRKPGFPYIPCHDICGTVEEVDSTTAPKFKVGDCIVATWDMIALGGLAEYILVDPKLAAAKPPGMSVVEASALANSAGHAVQIAKDVAVKEGERVLVLGGSGGVGTILLQLLRAAGPSFLAATSTQEALLKGLGVDQVIDYTKANWWEEEAFKAEPFDVIIDCAEGAPAWKHCREAKMIKPSHSGGRFVAVTMSDPCNEFHSWLDMVGFMGGMMGRSLGSRLAPSQPRHITHLSTITTDLLESVLAMADSGKLKVLLDEDSPFPFTEEGVKAAFTIQEDTHRPGKRHAHGKLVVLVNDPSSSKQ